MMDALAMTTLLCMATLAAIAGIAVLYDMYKNHHARMA